MRHYSVVYPQFWTGRTGRTIRELAKTSTTGKDVQRVALYLMTSPHANMIGLYFLPILYLCEEVGIDKPDAYSTLAELRRLDFSFYDETSEHVWVKEMARFQIGPALNQRDCKLPAINRMYQNLPANPWLGPFFDRYSSAYHLTDKRESSQGGPEGPPEGASRPLIRIGSDPVPVPVRIGSPEPTDKQQAETQEPNPDHATPEWITEQWNAIDGVTEFEDDLKGEIRDRIQTRIRERKSKAWWVEFFKKVAAGDWLCGRNEKGWRATLHWALGPVNMGKILAGHYPSNTGKPATSGAGAPPPSPHLTCNHHPHLPPCGLQVVSRVGNQRRCIWHNHLERHPELLETKETFQRYWPSINAAIRKNITADEAWRQTNSGRLSAAE